MSVCKRVSDTEMFQENISIQYRNSLNAGEFEYMEIVIEGVYISPSYLRTE